MRITDLESAVLAALDEGAIQAEGAIDVVLTDNPLAVSRAVSQLAAHEDDAEAQPLGITDRL